MGTFVHFRDVTFLEREAQQWRDRVVAFGGTVSASSLRAVSEFVHACKRAGIWNKLVRVNLICGDYIASMVPLKVGGGFALDLPQGTASSSEYTELGVDGGIQAWPVQNTSAPTFKWYDTGFIPAVHLTPGDVHIGVYTNSIGFNSSEYRVAIGAACTAGTGGDTNRLQIDGNPFGNYTLRVYLGAGYRRDSDNNLGGGGLRGHYMASIQGGVVSQVFNEAAYPGSAVDLAGPGTLPDQTIYFMAQHNPAGLSQYGTNATFAGYHIGHGLTASECLALSTAMVTFQKSLGRWVHSAVGDWQRRVRQAFSNNTSWDNAIQAIMGTFAAGCDAAGITSKFQRVNLFCGIRALQSRVPIFNGSAYYGQGSTVFADPLVGHADTDYTPASGWEKTVDGNSVVSAEIMPKLIGGLAVWVKEVPSQGTMIGWASPAPATDEWDITVDGGGTSVRGCFGGVTSVNGLAATSPLPGFYHVVRASDTDLRLYQNGVPQGVNTTLTTPVTTQSVAPATEALRQSFIIVDDVDTWIHTCGYSQETVALTPSEAAVYYTLWRDAQQALGRLETYGILTEAGDNLMASNGKQLATENA
jgi:hypothetical protein